MCGIIAAITNKKTEKRFDANEFVMNQFEDQHDRGKEGFGIIRINEGKIEIDRACETMKFLMDLYTKKAESIIAHHRTPTSTDNKLSQTHPISVKNKELEFDYLVIHNGMIRNDKELKKEHETLGYLYTTEYKQEGHYQYQEGIWTINKWNDSECLAIDVARFIEKKQKEINSEGSAAFIAIQIKKDTNEINRIFFGRKFNPINMKLEKGYILLSSEGPGEEIKEKKLFSISLNEITRKGKFRIKKRKIKYRSDRLEKEKEKEEKKKEKSNPQTITETPKITTQEILPSIKTIEKTIKEKKEKISIYEQEICDKKNDFIVQLNILDHDYWGNLRNSTYENEMITYDNFEEALQERQELIAEILTDFSDHILEPAYSKESDKPYRSMTLQMISKVMSSLENIANYGKTYTFKTDQEEIDKEIDDYKLGKIEEDDQVSEKNISYIPSEYPPELSGFHPRNHEERED